MNADLINRAVAPYQNLFGTLDTIITPDRAFDCFKAIADISAPTLTASYTRGPLLHQIVQAAQREGICTEQVTIDTNFRSTGNVALEVGSQQAKPVWSMAHLDNISFLTGALETGASKNRRYRLTPYCDPRQTPGRRPAHALIYDYAQKTMAVAADGFLCYDDDGNLPVGHFFETETANLPLATRIVYQSNAEWDQESGMVMGNIDNAFGCTALVLAAMVLSRWDVQSFFLLTDEEEGVVVPGPAAFSRGASRLLNRMAPSEFPSLITISDHHEEVAELMAGHLDLSHFGQGALFGAFASGTKGGVTPPRLLAHQRAMAGYLAQHQVQLTENAGYVGRSDCVTAMMATPNVSLIGYPAAYSHFVDTPRAHINDLVNLAKTLVIVHLLAQNAEWREAALG